MQRNFSLAIYSHYINSVVWKSKKPRIVLRRVWTPRIIQVEELLCNVSNNMLGFLFTHFLFYSSILPCSKMKLR